MLKMGGSFWRILLVIGAVSAADTSPSLKKPMSYEEAVELGVELYNRKAGEDFHYHLLEAFPQPQWDPNAEGTQELNFTIKETVCRKEDQLAKDKCDFKANGLVRQCLGYYFFEETPPVAVLTCEVVEEKVEHHPKRVKRFKKFFRKVKKGVRKFFKKKKVLIGATIPYYG